MRPTSRPRTWRKFPWTRTSVLVGNGPTPPSLLRGSVYSYQTGLRVVGEFTTTVEVSQKVFGLREETEVQDLCNSFFCFLTVPRLYGGINGDFDRTSNVDSHSCFTRRTGSDPLPTPTRLVRSLRRVQWVSLVSKVITPVTLTSISPHKSFLERNTFGFRPFVHSHRSIIRETCSQL